MIHPPLLKDGWMLQSDIGASAKVEGARFGLPIHTFTGREFWPLDPRSAEVDIEDIAHALSMQSRYAGHGRRFYSVAEHSVLVAGRASPANRLHALLHDASEAYLVDVPRPVKSFLLGYKEAEAKVMAAVWGRFGMVTGNPYEVDSIDHNIVADEMAQNMARPDPAYDNPIGITLEFWTPEQAEFQFLTMFYKLTEPV